MKNLTPEIIEKAKTAKTPEELLVLAKENGIEMTEESAAAYFDQLHDSGEVYDDELNNVAGGGCHKGDRLIVTVANSCELWTCKKCGLGKLGAIGRHYCQKGFWLMGDSYAIVCNNCKHISYEGGLWLCNHSDNRK